MLTRMWNKKKTHSSLVGKQKGSVTLEDSLAVSYKTNHTLIIQSSNCTPWYLPKGAEKVHSHKNLHTNVYSTFIHNCQNLEQPTYFLGGEWINKLWYIQTMKCYSVLKRNELSNHEKAWRKFKCLLLSERS